MTGLVKQISLWLLVGLLGLTGNGCIEEVDGNSVDPLSSNYVPSAPTNLYGYPATTTAILVAWRDNSLGEAGFQVDRREAQTAFAEIARTSRDQFSFYDESPELVRGRTYYYRVRAFSGSTNSAYSAEAAIVFP